MTPTLRLWVVSVGLLAAPASAQTHRFTIWAEAPETVRPGETFTVGFWGSVEGPDFIEGVSAMAGFGIDALGSGSVAGVSNVVVQPWAFEYGNSGAIVGADVRGVSGGQVHNPITPWLHFSFENPIPLFTIDVTAGDAGSISYAPGNPNPFGGLSFYLVWTSGTSIVAPNMPDTSLDFVGATTRIVPAPAPLTLACALALTHAGPRRRKS